MFSRRAVWSWALYDLANTIFYGVVVTGYLPTYVIDGMSGGEHAPYALAFYPAMILAGLVSPALGEYADARGFSKRATLIASLACIAATMLLPLPSRPLPLLALFAFALFAYQSALVFYNALLPTVADASTEGAVSGLGTGLGYFGNVLALPLAMFVVKLADGDARPAFVLAAVLFFAFTVPLAMFCPESRATRPHASLRVGKVTRRTFDLLREACSNKALLCFFLGNFLCSDVLGSIYAYLVPFVRSGEGLGIERPVTVLFAINVVAFPVCVAMGRVADRRGAKAMSITGAVALFVAIAAAQVLHAAAEVETSSWLHHSAFGLELYQWIGAGGIVVFGSIGMGGVVGASRQWLLRLVPHDEVGAWYGIYGLTGKLSLLSLWPFAILRDRTGGYGASIALLSALLVAGIACFCFVPRDVKSQRATS